MRTMVMQPSSRIEGIETPLVLDASAVINLIASGQGMEILVALPTKCLVTQNVLTELGRGIERHRESANILDNMLRSKTLNAIDLHPGGYDAFESLVGGNAPDTLDDGEAATIAHAIAISGVPVIDERKGRRVCQLYHPKLFLASSLDLFAHPHVASSLSNEVLRRSLLHALNDARMNVLPDQVEWLVSLVGEEEAKKCRTLRRVLKFEKTPACDVET